jgi:hypothetical protein
MEFTDDNEGNQIDSRSELHAPGKQRDFVVDDDAKS